MNNKQPETRTEATKPEETRHLDPGQKKALDLGGDAEHADGPEREKLTRKAEELGGGEASSAE
jgi:hypothetical protein